MNKSQIGHYYCKSYFKESLVVVFITTGAQMPKDVLVSLLKDLRDQYLL